MFLHLLLQGFWRQGMPPNMQISPQNKLIRWRYFTRVPMVHCGICATQHIVICSQTRQSKRHGWTYSRCWWWRWQQCFCRLHLPWHAVQDNSIIKICCTSGVCLSPSLCLSLNRSGQGRWPPTYKQGLLLCFLATLTKCLLMVYVLLLNHYYMKIAQEEANLLLNTSKANFLLAEANIWFGEFSINLKSLHFVTIL